MPGLLITLEGGEGSGKTTQARLLLSRLQSAGIRARGLREPGGTEVGENIRRILLDTANAGMDPRTEILLYEAARAQLVSEVIEPALESGEIIICDRFFDSTTAYQGFARGLSLDMVSALNDAATGGLRPRRTLFFDIDPRLGIDRATRRGADRLEGEDASFHASVRQGFLSIASAEPDRFRVIDASGTVDEVSTRVIRALSDLEQLRPVLDVC